MNITSVPLGPAASARLTSLPSTLGSLKSGACVPSGSIVLGVRTMFVSKKVKRMEY